MFDRLCAAFTDAGIVEPAAAGDLDPGGLAELIAVTRRLEAVLVARRLAAVEALLWHRLVPENQNPDRQYDFVDGCEKTSAEVSALLDISPMAARFAVHYAQVLGERLPKVAALLSAGRVDWRTVQLIINRTDLVIDSDLASRLDEILAQRLDGWGSWSRRRILAAVDALVYAIDPDAAKARRHRDEQDRRIGIGPLPNGMAELRGMVRATDAARFDRKLSELARGVCPGDPRTIEQRRADALDALAAGRRLRCECGRVDCGSALTELAGPCGPNRPGDDAGGGVVIHVVAAEDTLSGAGDRPGYLVGYGVIDADLVREVAARASQRPIDTEANAGDPLCYAPSATLARAIRCRDLTCRFPGCDRPAERCDIDHTVAFDHADPTAGGLTVPENLKCLCRQHHRLKTFDGGWRDRQLADATVIWTAPTGHTFVTKPAGAEVFPELARRRARPRAQQRASAIARARSRNHVQRPLNEAARQLRQARKIEIEGRKFRNHMRDMLFVFKGKPSTSPVCTWVNDPYESEELPPDWRPPTPPTQPDEPPF